MMASFRGSSFYSPFPYSRSRPQFNATFTRVPSAFGAHSASSHLFSLPLNVLTGGFASLLELDCLNYAHSTLRGSALWRGYSCEADEACAAGVRAHEARCPALPSRSPPHVTDSSRYPGPSDYNKPVPPPPTEAVFNRFEEDLIAWTYYCECAAEVNKRASSEHRGTLLLSHDECWPLTPPL